MNIPNFTVKKIMNVFIKLHKNIPDIEYKLNLYLCTRVIINLKDSFRK